MSLASSTGPRTLGRNVGETELSVELQAKINTVPASKAFVRAAIAAIIDRLQAHGLIY